MTEIPTYAFIIVGAGLFSAGLFGILTSSSGIRLLMSIELMLNAANLNFAAFSNHWGDSSGQVYVLFSIALAAGEAAVGLGILINLFRRRGTVNVRSVNALRW